MCMACEEMQLFYAYLDAVEEAKRKAQPWECEVTVIPQDGEATAAPQAAGKFACDDTTSAVEASAPTAKP
jgi:hypothetical protein